MAVLLRVYCRFFFYRGFMNSNPALATALAHRSIRKFTQQPIAPEILNP